jgi:hypothetical protein
MSATAGLAIVDITSVFPEAIQVRADELKLGDKVFDAMGGQHKLTVVRPLKNGNISTKRDDHRYTEHWYPHEIITIIRESEAKA